MKPYKPLIAIMLLGAAIIACKKDSQTTNKFLHTVNVLLIDGHGRMRGGI